MSYKLLHLPDGQRVQLVPEEDVMPLTDILPPAEHQKLSHIDGGRIGKISVIFDKHTHKVLLTGEFDIVRSPFSGEIMGIAVDWDQAHPA